MVSMCDCLGFLLRTIIFIPVRRNKNTIICYVDHDNCLLKLNGKARIITKLKMKCKVRTMSIFPLLLTRDDRANETTVQAARE